MDLVEMESDDTRGERAERRTKPAKMCGGGPVEQSRTVTKG
jgi:hypothetical protein